MITQIQTSVDVKTFAEQLLAEGVSFHPDDDFNDMVNLQTNQPAYSQEEAAERNRLMSQCFDVCEKEGLDIYDIAMEITLVETGLDNLIPLPSQQYAG